MLQFCKSNTTCLLKVVYFSFTVFNVVSPDYLLLAYEFVASIM